MEDTNNPVANVESSKDAWRVSPILSTPFRTDESVDVGAVQELSQWTLDTGVDALVALGFASELFRLRDRERQAILEAVVEAVAGRVPVVAGVAGSSTRAVQGYVAEAAEAGADAVLVPPPIGASGISENSLRAYYAAVAEVAPEVGIVLQDEPINSRVTQSAALIASVMDEIPQIRWAKIEEGPCASKIQSIREHKARNDVILFGGRGGIELIDELRAGGVGAMTGFAFPEVLMRVVDAWRSGQEHQARATFYAYLPLIAFEAQEGIGIAIRKEIIRRRGGLTSSKVREPGLGLSPELAKGLDDVLRHLVDQRLLSLDKGWQPPMK